MKNKILLLFMLALLVVAVPITTLADDDDRASGGGGSEVIVTLHYCDDEDTTVTFNAGYMENMPKSPTKPNYRFTGWYTDKDGGLEVNEYFNRTYDVPKDWYAHWTNVSSFTYTIPAELKIDNNTNKGAINFSGVLDKMHSLNVTVTSQNNNKLVNGNQSIGYSVDKNSFSYQSESKSKTINETINILVNGKGTVAGSYNDKLTFNISVEQLTLKSGDIIDIEGKQYTVIEQVNDNRYKVLANELANNGQKMVFDSTGDYGNGDYATSNVATYLDGDYYNSLDANVKSAIVETSIKQKIASDLGKNSPTWTGEVREAGIHKVFVPSWDEVTKVYGSTLNTLTKYVISNSTINNWIWIRDVFDRYVLYVLKGGVLNGSIPRNAGFVRPAMVLDLSKVNFAKVEPGSSDETTNDTDVIAPVMAENTEIKIEEPIIVEANKDVVPEETDEPKDNETSTVKEEKTATDVIEEPSTSEPVINEATETISENAVVTEPNAEEETE